MQARELGYVFKETGRKSWNDDVLGLASEAAFSFAFSLFPLLLLMVVLLGVFGQYPEFTIYVNEFLADFLPPDSLRIITEYIASLEVGDPKGLLSISIFLTLWPASSVVGAYIKAINRAYETRDARPFWKDRLLAIALVLLMGALVAISFLGMVFGPVAGDFISDYMGMSDIYRVLLDTLRFPVAVIASSVALAVLYRFGPNIPHRWYEIWPGAFLATFLWVTITFSFSLYVEYFGRYNKTYGSLGGVIILLTWMYLTSLAVILGAEFNGAFGRWMRGEGLPKNRR